MVKIVYLRNYKDKKAGDIDYVSNNVAFGLVDQGAAMRQTSSLMSSPADKMMRLETKAERKVRQRRNRYQAK